MSQLSHADVAQWYLKAGHRRLWVLPLSVVLSIFVIFLVLRRMAEDPYANLQESRAALRSYKQTLPDEKNALVAISETWKLRVLWDPKNPDDLPIYALWQDKTILNQVRAENYWKACEPELVALKQALKIPDAWSNYDPEGAKSGWPPYLSLLNLRNSSNLLTFDAYMHASRGNHVSASQSLREIQRVAEHIESDPGLIALMIAEAIRSIPGDDFWNWLLNEAPPLDDAALRAYQDSLNISDRVFPALARTYEFERCLSLYMSDEAQIDKFAARIPQSRSGLYEALMYGSDRACKDGVYSEMISTLKAGAFPQDMESILARHQRGPSVLGRMNFKSMHRTWLAVLSNHTQARLLHTALAVQRYQNKYKRDPQTLEELVPEFLKEIPHDFAGHPLKLKTPPFPDQIDYGLTPYRQDQSGSKLMIYSFGPNGRDEGGANNGSYDKKKPDDFSIQLRGVETRGTAP